MLCRLRLGALLFVSALGVVAPISAQSAILLVREDNPDTLLKYEGGTLSSVGNIGFFDVRGLAYDATTDTLFAVSRQALRLLTVDTTTGAGAEVADNDYLPGGSNTAELDLTADGVLLGQGQPGDQSTSVTLLEVDKATGIAGVVGMWGNPAMFGIAVDHSDGTIYGTTFGGDLYTIDPSGTSVTLVGTITGTNGTVARMAFDQADGTLYGMTSVNQLVTIDLGTLVATQVEQFGGNQMYAITTLSSAFIFQDGFESGDTSSWSSTVE